jgi:hypothetical protein
MMVVRCVCCSLTALPAAGSVSRALSLDSDGKLKWYKRGRCVVQAPRDVGRNDVTQSSGAPCLPNDLACLSIHGTCFLVRAPCGIVSRA